MKPSPIRSTGNDHKAVPLRVLLRRVETVCLDIIKEIRTQNKHTQKYCMKKFVSVLFIDIQMQALVAALTKQVK